MRSDEIVFLLRTWKKMPKTEGLASVNIDSVASGNLTRFVRWKVHGDWVQVSLGRRQLAVVFAMVEC